MRAVLFSFVGIIEHDKFIRTMWEDEPYQRGELEQRAAAEAGKAGVADAKLGAESTPAPEGAEPGSHRRELIRAIVALLDDTDRLWSAREVADVMEGVYAEYASRPQVLPQDVRRKAASVFGSSSSADAWLRQPQSLLDGQAPIDVLSDPVGRGAVLEILGRIAHGSYS